MHTRAHTCTRSLLVHTRTPFPTDYIRLRVVRAPPARYLPLYFSLSVPISVSVSVSVSVHIYPLLPLLRPLGSLRLATTLPLPGARLPISRSARESRRPRRQEFHDDGIWVDAASDHLPSPPSLALLLSFLFGRYCSLPVVTGEMIEHGATNRVQRTPVERAHISMRIRSRSRESIFLKYNTCKRRL